MAAGANGASPHHEPGGRAIRHGDAVVMDFGGLLDGRDQLLLAPRNLGFLDPNRLFALDADDADLFGLDPLLLNVAFDLI